MGTLIALLLLVLIGAGAVWFLAARFFVKTAKFVKKLTKPFFDNLTDDKEE